MYSSTTEGCCRAPSKFLRAGFSEERVALKPNRNPWVIPVMKNSVRAVSGWSERYIFHFSWLSGVVMLAASGGTRTAVDVLEIWDNQSGSQSE